MHLVRTRFTASIVLAAAAIAACGGRAASPPPAQSTSPTAKAAPAASTTTSAATSKDAVTEERFCALVDRLAEKIDGSITAALDKKDLTPDEAAEVLRRIAPDGARGDMAEIVAASGLDPMAVAAFVRDQKEAAKRCADRLSVHVEASLQRAGPILEKAKQAKPASPAP